MHGGYKSNPALEVTFSFGLIYPIAIFIYYALEEIRHKRFNPIRNHVEAKRALQLSSHVTTLAPIHMLLDSCCGSRCRDSFDKGFLLRGISRSLKSEYIILPDIFFHDHRYKAPLPPCC